MRHSLTTMAAPLAAAALLLLAACGSAGANGQAGDEPVPRAAPAPGPDGEDEPAAASGSGISADGLAGAWENASCGERKYRRRIEFFAGGRFAAVDEVAPCPPGARCVWSGIIRWQGTWRLEHRSISIAVEPTEGDRLPEVVPGSFEVVADAPATLAERTGELVCPYRRID